MPDTLTPVLTTSEVAGYLRLNVQTVQAYVRQGKFPGASTVGGKYLIPAPDVEAFLNPPAPVLAPRNNRSRAQQTGRTR